MLSYLRQGKISKWFSGIGQEAIAVACTAALHPDEMIFPMHRNLGVFTSRDISLRQLYAQWQGKMEGFTKGRDRSFHFGSLDHHIVGMISHLGPQLSLAAGVALAYKNRGEKKVSLAFTGEGGTSEGEFHEALNLAAVWQLPVIFIIENNGYGLSTPTSEQYRCEHLVDRAQGYGIEGVRIEGNDVLEVYHQVSAFAQRSRETPQPFLIECNTFRQRGHEEASGTKYVPQDLMDEWIAKDPVEQYRQYLLDQGVMSAEQDATYRSQIAAYIKEELSHSDSFTDPVHGSEIIDAVVTTDTTPVEPSANLESKRFIDAISEALDLGMSRHPELVLMGQDIADYGGVFKITDGLLAKYGADRVRNTPLCESAVLGAALGLSLTGMKAMVEMQFADFVTCGFNQIVNNLAKIHYRWGAPADVVVRMPTGGTMRAGPFHSQSNEAWFFHVPGLRIVYPSTPADAKGLLLTALRDPAPYLYFEHKALYRSLEDEVPTGYYELPVGKARIVRSGSQATIITYGMGVKWAEDWVAGSGSDVAILDLRWLSPLDHQAMRDQAAATHRILVLHEDNQTGGIGAEIAAWITEECWEDLDAPVMRCGSLDTPIPFAPALEDDYMASQRLGSQMDKLLSY